jgi:hypothetical protein
MDISFVGEKENFMVIYLDHITIFSKYDDEHLQHIKQKFQKCKRYGTSLNPKKSHFFYVRRKYPRPHYIIRGNKDRPGESICYS